MIEYLESNVSEVRSVLSVPFNVYRVEWVLKENEYFERFFSSKEKADQHVKSLKEATYTLETCFDEQPVITEIGVG